MNYYNVVLLPPKELSEKLIAFAQDNFKDFADGYCLSESVFPHITLCQFKAEKVPNISMDNVNKTPCLMTPHIRVGSECYVGVELVVKNDYWLLSLHNNIKHKLISKEVEILTNDYSPHLTFCGVHENDQHKVNLNDVSEDLLGTHEGWTVQVGNSDENGQYLG